MIGPLYLKDFSFGLPSRITKKEKAFLLPNEKLDFGSPITVLTIAGHGFDTKGKRSPYWSDGSQLREWLFNRHVDYWVRYFLYQFGINYKQIVTEKVDVSLDDRFERVNNFKKENFNHNIFVVELHGNAYGLGGVSGIEGFTTTGQDKSDLYCNEILKSLEKMNWNMRYDMLDNDRDKEVNYYIIRKLKEINIPGCLLELGFYTNEKECKEMMKPEIQKKLGRLIAEGILNTIKLYSLNVRSS